jgi:hypothetical protein
VALSGDGSTLAVGAYGDDSNEMGINNGPGTDNSATEAGAVHVFVRNDAVWSQQAYVKASNTGSDDRFGSVVALSGDGNTLAVRAHAEDSNLMGIGGDGADDFANDAGAVYVFGHNGGVWSQRAYVKASNTGPGDFFGISVALSGDGTTLAVGATREDSNDPGVSGDQANDFAVEAGAVYLY